MVKNIWVIEDINKENPVETEIGDRETVGQFRARQARKRDLSMADIDLGTDSKKLNDDNKILAKEIKSGETVYILPRAKGGQ